MDTATPAGPALLQARGLSKAFAGVQALREVSLEIAPGQVHALLGENGAGKSTLAKILAGLHRPDAGTIHFQGCPVRLPHPHAALRLGIALIHQELMPFPDLSVAENIFMGHEPAWRGLGWIDRRRLHAQARSLLARLGVSLAPDRPMRGLSVAHMQAVEIAKALAHQARLLIMDEPTSALSAREAERLFALITELTRQGVAVLYISHKLEEVFRLAQTVTVLRDGRHVATRPLAELNPQRLIALMVGRELAAPARGPAPPPGECLLAVRGLGRAGRFADLSFELRRGEVVGLAGLMGAGRTDLLNALYGLAPADRGQIFLRGRPVRLTCPRDALRQGVAWVSEDRQQYGLVPGMSVTHNLTLPHLRRCGRAGFIERRRENRLADQGLRALDIRLRHPGQPADSLSGGNQQKLLLARALLAEPDILLLDEPTRGIDIAAKADIHALILRLARAGKAVLLASSELPELLALSDRLLVLCQGRLTAELDPRQTTPEQVLQHAMPA